MNKRVTLAELIRDHQATSNASYNDLAKATGLSKAKIGQIANGDSGMPRVETLEKLARGLSLPLSVVKSAAMVSAGMSDVPDDDDPDTAVLVTRFKELPPADRETVRDLVNVLHQRTRRPRP